MENQVHAKGDVNRLGYIFYLRAQFARCKNDLTGTIEYSRQALVLLNDNELQIRSLTYIALAVVYLNNGEVDKALAAALEALTFAKRSNSRINQLYIFFLLGDLYTLQGNLQMAIINYKEIIKFAPQALPSPILAYLRLANIYLEQNKIELAQEYLKIGEEFVNSGGLNYVPLANGVYAGLWWPQGDAVAGLQIYPAEVNSYPPRHRVVAQLEALKGRFTSTNAAPVRLIKWSQTRFGENYSLPKPFDYQQEPEYLELARVLIYQHKYFEAKQLLTELRYEAETQNRRHSLLKNLLVLALAVHASGEALIVVAEILEEALTLAEAGGYSKVFTEEGKPLKQLLIQSLPLLGTATNYAHNVLAAFSSELKQLPAPELQTSQYKVNTLNLASLPEVLTERELDVLYLLGEGASNQEIANRLVVTLSTVKKHLTNILEKLNSTNRTQAVIRARELRIL